MSDLAALPHFEAVAGDYDVLFCDVWGVVHNGRESWPAPCDALARFRARGGRVVLVSNSPRPAPGVIVQLDALGVPRDAWDAVVTSGDATRRVLAQRAPGPAWIIGPDRDGPLYEGLGLDVAEGAEDAAFLSVTGPYDDAVETPEDYRERLTPAAARGLEMICANPDKVVRRGDALIYCGGALADLYTELGGPVTLAGKPHAPIYDLSMIEAERLMGRTVDRRRVLCVGDGVVTDVLGAERQGLDCLFVAAGIHEATADAEGRLDLSVAAALLNAEGVTARYACLELAW